MMRRVGAQTKVELLLTLRRGESLLVVAGIPVAVLVFFSSVRILPHHGRMVDFLVPGVLALAVIASAMTSLGIATGFERHAGVLRRLGTTPLGRSGLLFAKIVSLVFVVVLQAVLVCAVGKAIGWRPHGNPFVAVGIGLLGVVAFAAIGFLLAGTLRAETNLAVANALFLAFLFLGGVIVPASSLPEALARLARILPASPLSAAMRATLSAQTVNPSDVIVLAVWAVVATFAAARWFRWD
jgi:ABC-2 type transport system permease protein